MFFNSKDYIPYGVTTINCLISDSGIGDQLCALMPINYIINNCPWINLLVWVPDFMIEFSKHVLPSNVIVRGFSEAKKKYDDKRAGITTSSNNQHTPMRVHPTKFAYHVLCDMEPNLEQLSYLKIRPSEIDLSHFNLPEKFVVLQGAYTETVKTMPVDTFNKLVDYITEKGYTLVFLGKTQNQSGIKDIIYTAKSDKNYNLSGINLLNKTSLLESAAIIAKSKLFIGLDGGLSHITGFTDTKAVVGYTFASHEQLMPTRDGIFGKGFYPIIPDESLDCKFCQTKISLYYNHDFRNCFKTVDKFECTKQMTFDKFKQKIEENNLL